MSLSICPLASGSKGNATLLRVGNTIGLIDAGLSYSILESRLWDIGIDINSLEFVVITHEHDDHISALPNIENDLHIPIYGNAETLNAIKYKKKISLKNAIDIDFKGFNIGDAEIKPFEVSHDSIRPFGYTVTDGYKKISYATDLGYVSEKIKTAVKDSSLIVIECNHDKDMLLNGTYPPYLKKRVIGQRGHLSNTDCATFAVDCAKQGVKNLILAHLSEENNLPELAYYENVNALRNAGATSSDMKITIALQRKVGSFIKVGDE